MNLKFSFLRQLRPAAFFAILGACAVVGCNKKEAPPPPESKVPEIVAEPDEAAPVKAEAVIDPAIPELKINKSAQLAILCYHDFIKGRSSSDMKLNIDHFRSQMQAIKDARLPVISMELFLQWRRGEADIPDPCVMITMDDGWNSVHNLAMPVLKEFGYPFTIFLYKKYVNVGGRALKSPEIREIMANGGAVGSHSVSHPLNIKQVGSRTPEEYEAFLRNEVGESKRFLEEEFMIKVPTYAHPGGSFNQRVLELGEEYGYAAMFTVNPAKCSWDTPSGLIPRYVVDGRDSKDLNFRAALSFRGISTGELGRQLLGSGEDGSAPLVATHPAPDATIAERLPLISVDVSKLEGIDPATILMRIAGIGEVQATFDERTGHITHQMAQRLRGNECHVHVSFQRKGQPKPDMVTWKFFIDLVALYLPELPTPVELPKAQPVMEEKMIMESQAEPPLPEGEPAGQGN